MSTVTGGRTQWTVLAPALAVVVLAGSWGRDLSVVVSVLVALLVSGS